MVDEKGVLTKRNKKSVNFRCEKEENE